MFSYQWNHFIRGHSSHCHCARARTASCVHTHIESQFDGKNEGTKNRSQYLRTACKGFVCALPLLFLRFVCFLSPLTFHIFLFMTPPLWLLSKVHLDILGLPVLIAPSRWGLFFAYSSQLDDDERTDGRIEDDDGTDDGRTADDLVNPNCLLLICFYTLFFL